MWKLNEPKQVKLIIGILAANYHCLHTAADFLSNKFGKVDFSSDVWPFDQTDYYKEQTGPRILRQFVSIKKLSFSNPTKKNRLLLSGQFFRRTANFNNQSLITLPAYPVYSLTTMREVRARHTRYSVFFKEQ